MPKRLSLFKIPNLRCFIAKLVMDFEQLEDPEIDGKQGHYNCITKRSGKSMVLLSVILRNRSPILNLILTPENQERPYRKNMFTDCD